MEVTEEDAEQRIEWRRRLRSNGCSDAAKRTSNKIMGNIAIISKINTCSLCIIKTM